MSDLKREAPPPYWKANSRPQSPPPPHTNTKGKKMNNVNNWHPHPMEITQPETTQAPISSTYGCGLVLRQIVI